MLDHSKPPRSQRSGGNQRKKDGAKAKGKRLLLDMQIRADGSPEFEKLVDEQLKVALAEVGPVKPQFDEEYHRWIFEHPLYPVEYDGDTKQEVIKGYPLHLREFIWHRLYGDLAPEEEARTSGRGGKREGAGRPKGTTKEPTRVVSLPVDIANWLQSNSAHLLKVRKLMSR